MASIGQVVRLLDDPYYGTNNETDHIFILNIYDGKFDGIGITTKSLLTGGTLKKWGETLEGINTKTGHSIKVKKRDNEENIYDIYIESVGYKGCALPKQLIKMIPILIEDEYASPYSIYN